MNLAGQKVKLFLINSLSAEGTVHSWNESEVVLISNQKRLVINNPNNNIIMYYIFDSLANSEASLSQNKNPEPSPEKIEPDSSQEDFTNSSASLRLKRIADLKIMAAQAQRDQIRKQLTTFHAINTDQILGKYGTPSFINPQHSSPQEINNGDAANAGSVSELPGEASK